MKKVVIVASSGKGGRRHEWWTGVENMQDFALALGLFIEDYQKGHAKR